MALNLGPLNVLLRLQGASRFRRETESVSGSMLKTGAAITAGALAARKIAQEIVEATKVFAEFERSMVRVGAVTNSLGTQAFAGLTERAQELAQTTEFSGRQVANAMGFMGMAGMSTNKIFESTPAVLQLASAGMVDVATAADTVTNIMAGYGIEAKDLGKANDVLVATFTNSNTSLQQLGQSFKYVGPVAKSAGVEFREAAAVIGLMGNAGIQADMAGTALRGTIIKLLDPTKEGAEIMRQYGINATDSAGKLRPMVEIFRQLEPIADDSAKMIELFGLRAGPGMQAALSQGTAALERLIGKIDAAGGIAERIADAQLDTLDGKIKILGSNFEALQIAIGEAFAPTVTGGVEALSGYLADATTAVKELVAATDDASGSITEFGTAANTAMRNYLRAIGATLGLNMDAVELTYEKTEAESKLAAALEREEQIRARLAYLGQEATFQTKQFGVASNVVTSEIQQLTEELEAAHGVVLRMGRDMRKVTAGGFPVARVNPNLGQDPAFQPRKPPPTTRARAAAQGPSAFDTARQDYKAMLAPTDLESAASGLVDALASIGYEGAIAVKNQVAATFTPRVVGDVISPLIESTNAVVEAQAEQTEAAADFADKMNKKIAPGIIAAIKGIESGTIGAQVGSELGGMAGSAIGNALLPGAGGAVGGAIGSALGGIAGSAFDELIAALGVLTPIFDLFADLISTMSPALIILREMLAATGKMLFDALGPNMTMLFQMFAKFLYPVLVIFEALGPIIGIVLNVLITVLQFLVVPALEMLGSILTFLTEKVVIPVAEVFLEMYNVIVDFINGITQFIRDMELFGGTPFAGFGMMLEKVNTNLRTYDEVMAGETEARAEATESLREFNEELTNIPLGVKRLRLLQYGATRGQTAFPNRFNAPAWGA